MANQIKEIPELPDELKEAVNRGRLVIFIGAGVSRLCGCRGWDDLAKNLIDECYNKKIINYQTRESLKLSSNSQKQLITIAYKLLKPRFENLFFDKMNDALTSKKNDETEDARTLYDSIYKLRGKFVTTNADKLFDYRFEKSNIVFDENSFTKENFENREHSSLFKIHGSIDKTKSLVFTLPQYMKRYSNDSFKDFLRSIFDNYTVLFLGYGLSEFEILESLIMNGKITTHNHFLLHGYYPCDEKLLEAHRLYYSELNIEIVGYSRGEIGYKQLIKIIDRWSVDMKSTNFLINSIGFVEDNAKEYKEENKSAMAQFLRESPQAKKFLEVLIESPNPASWFDTLFEENYFTNSDKGFIVRDGRFVRSTGWTAFAYLGRLAEYNKNINDRDIFNKLTIIIQSLMHYSANEFNLHSTFLEILSTMIGNDIESKLDSSILQIVENCNINTNIPMIIAHYTIPATLKYKREQLFIKILNNLLVYREIESFMETKEYVGSISNYNFRDIYIKHIDVISELWGKEVIQLCFEKIDKFLEEYPEGFDSWKIRSIDDCDLSDYDKSEFDKQLIVLIKELIKRLDSSTFAKKVDEFIAQAGVKNRLSIFIIDHFYNYFCDKFWSIDWNPLDSSRWEMKPEVYDLIKNNAQAIVDNTVHLDKLIEWVKDIEFDIQGDNQVMKEAFARKEWLYPLLYTGNSKVKKEYDKYDSINNAEPHMEGRNARITIISGSSRYEYEELSIMTASKLIKCLNEFDEHSYESAQNGWNKMDLGRTLEGVVAADPSKYIDEIDLFLKLKKDYLTNFIEGIKNSWKNKIDIDVSKVLYFVSNVTTDDSFWQGEEKYERYSEWFAKEVARFIVEGYKSEERSFGQEYLEKCEAILIELEKRAESTGGWNNVDYPTIQLNTTLCAIYEAMIMLSLSWAKNNKELDKSRRWKPVLKEFFDKALNSTTPKVQELIMTLGKFLANIDYLDSDWLKSNLDKIFPLDNEEYFKASFSCYVSYTGQVYGAIYRMLKESGIYQHALQFDFGHGTLATTRRFIEQITLGYKYSGDELNDKDGLIYKLLNEGNSRQLLELVWFVPKLVKYDDSGLDLVKNLWNELTKSKREIGEVKRSLWQWGSLFNEPEDIEVDLIASIESFDQSEPFRFVEYVEELVEKDKIELSFRLFKKMVEVAGPVESFRRDMVKEIIEAFYKAPEKVKKEDVDVICNKYAEEGYELGRDLFNKYNS